MEDQQRRGATGPTDDRIQEVGPVMAAGSEKGHRDTLAVVVFVVGLAALFVVGYFALSHLSKGIDIRSGKGVSEWAAELEQYGRDLLARVPGGLISGGDPVKEARRHLKRGYDLYMKNRPDRALEECAKAVELDPKNHQSYYWRGRVYMRLKRYDPALEDFRTAVRLKPDYREAHDNLGWLYERKRQYDEALSHLSRSIQLAPNHAWAYYHRAMVLYSKGDVGRALEDARKACELKNEDGCRLYEEYRKKSGRT
ncbi:MAG: tetratricopeptide repeat protein [Deltaproteobacteria bacterium]|nr:tetratricopeptide repeat protein [Deltaproteobacteria bacterium]